jgi:transcriptional regulator with XRE-family HTH domain
MPRASVRSDGKKILRHRTERGLTQESLAAISSYSKRTIERLEAGTDTTVSTLVVIAQVLCCPPDELLEAGSLEKMAIQSRIQLWLEHKQEEKRIDERAKTARLEQICTESEDPAAVRITCRSLSKRWDPVLKKNVSLAGTIHPFLLCTLILVGRSQSLATGLEFFILGT